MVNADGAALASGAEECGPPASFLRVRLLPALVVERDEHVEAVESQLEQEQELSE